MRHVGTILFTLCVVCAGVYAFPILAKFRVGLRRLPRNVCILTLRHPLRTGKLILLWAAALLLMYLTGFMGPLFSGPLPYAAARTCRRMFERYIDGLRCGPRRAV